jgi:hypothetical protein
MKWLCDYIENKNDISGRGLAEKMGIQPQRYFFYKGNFPNSARFKSLARFILGLRSQSGLSGDQILDAIEKDLGKKNEKKEKTSL